MYEAHSWTYRSYSQGAKNDSPVINCIRSCGLGSTMLAIFNLATVGEVCSSNVSAAKRILQWYGLRLDFSHPTQ